MRNRTKRAPSLIVARQAAGGSALVRDDFLAQSLPQREGLQGEQPPPPVLPVLDVFLGEYGSACAELSLTGFKLLILCRDVRQSVLVSCIGLWLQ